MFYGPLVPETDAWEKREIQYWTNYFLFRIFFFVGAEGLLHIAAGCFLKWRDTFFSSFLSAGDVGKKNPTQAFFISFVLVSTSRIDSSSIMQKLLAADSCVEKDKENIPNVHWISFTLGRHAWTAKKSKHILHPPPIFLTRKIRIFLPDPCV